MKIEIDDIASALTCAADEVGLAVKAIEARALEQADAFFLLDGARVAQGRLTDFVARVKRTLERDG
jgi:hypothetical protein